MKYSVKKASNILRITKANLYYDYKRLMAEFVGNSYTDDLTVYCQSIENQYNVIRGHIMVYEEQLITNEHDGLKLWDGNTYIPPSGDINTVFFHRVYKSIDDYPAFVIDVCISSLLKMKEFKAFNISSERYVTQCAKTTENIHGPFILNNYNVVTMLDYYILHLQDTFLQFSIDARKARSEAIPSDQMDVVIDQANKVQSFLQDTIKNLDNAEFDISTLSYDYDTMIFYDCEDRLEEHFYWYLILKCQDIPKLVKDFCLLQIIANRERIEEISSQDFVLQNDDVDDTSSYFDGITSLVNFVKQDANFDVEYVMKLLEDSLLWYKDLQKATCNEDVILSFLRFYKMRTNGSIICSVLRCRMISYIKDKIFTESERDPNWDYDEETKDDEFVMQSDRVQMIFYSLRDLIDKYDEIKNSPAFKKIYRFFLFGLSNSLFASFGVDFDACGYSEFEAKTLKKKFYKGADFYHCLLDTSLYVLQQGYNFIKTGDPDIILHSGTSYETWYESTLSVPQKLKNIGNDYSEDHFLKDLDEMITKGEIIYKHCFRAAKSESVAVRRRLDDLIKIFDDIQVAQNARCLRKAPLGVLVFGPSKVGKSTFIEILLSYFCQVTKLPNDDGHRFYVNADANYMDGIKPWTHSVILDEMAKISPRYAPQGDPSLANVLQIINNMPFLPDQAKLEDKGKIPMKPSLVLATTNVEDINAKFYYSCQAAVRRRFEFITILRVKEDFCNSEGALDSSKVNTSKGFCDIWYITVKQLTPSKDGKSVTEHICLKDADIKDFLVFYKEVILKHRKQQDQVMDCINAIKQDYMCPYCSLPSRSLCSCPTVRYEGQSEETGNLIETGLLWMCFKTFFFLNFIIAIAEFRWAPFTRFQYFCHKIGFIEFIARSITRKSSAIHRKFVIFLARYRPRLFYRYLGNRIQYAMNIPAILFDLLKFVTACLIIVKLMNVGHRYGQKIQTKLNNFYNRNKSELKETTDHFNLTELERESIERSQMEAEDLLNLSEDNGEHQGQNVCKELPDGNIPKPGLKEHVNVWFNNDYTLTSFDVPDKIKSSKLSVGDLFTKIKRNIVHITINPKGPNGKRGRGLFLKGQLLLVNNHTIPDTAHTIQVIDSIVKDGVSSNLSFKIDSSCYKRFPQWDLAIIECKNLPPFKDITKYFFNSGMNALVHGVYMNRSHTGDFIQKNCLSMHKIKINFEAVGVSLHNIFVWKSKMDKSTIKGESGSVVLGSTHYGSGILGIHSIGHVTDGISFAVNVDSSMLQHMLKDYGCVFQSGEPMISSETCDRALKNLHFKSTIRYISEGSARVYGSFENFRAPYKSMVQDSLMAPSLKHYGYTKKFTKPLLSGWEPWRIAQLDMVKPVNTLSPSMITRCKNDFVDDIVHSLPKKEFDNFEVYTDFTAINGAAGVGFVDAVKKNTSTGCPWKTVKKKFMVQLPPQNGLDEPYRFTDEIMSRVRKIENNYLEGQRSYPIFCGNLKDEPVTFKKREMGKTRVFTGSPIDFTIVVRKYFLSYTRVAQNNRILFENAVGMNVMCSDWTTLYEHLTKFGEDRMVAGDYKSFDKRMSPDIILAAFDIIISLYRISGNFTDDQLKICKGIAYDIAFPTIDYNGDLIEYFGSNPSGHPLTVHINSLVNSLYIRYCFYSIYDSKKFSNNVNLITYGDDNIMSVSKECDDFNHTSISELLSKLDITYTMADKEAKSIPFINISECSFLKRSWVKEPFLKGYACPLEHDSIEKMLMVWTRSKTIPAEEQAIAVINSAVREYFFYGHTVFNVKRNLLMKIIHELDIEQYVLPTTFPSYEQLWEAYVENSGDYFSEDWVIETRKNFDFSDHQENTQ